MNDFKFYFDYLSPFSYIAWEKLKKTNYQFSLHPVALGSLLNHWQIKGPGEIKPKREFLLKQCYRISAQENISFHPPLTHPFNPLYALRMSLNSSSCQQRRVVDLFWKAAWQRGQNLGEPEECIQVLKEGGLNGEEIYEKSFSKEARSELKKNITQAIEANIFGVPSFLVKDELFWGQDSLHFLQQYLEGRDLLDRKAFENSIGL